MRSTKAFYIFTFLTKFGLGSICSIYVLYLLDIGLSYSELALVNALYFVFIILFELPTGMLADGRGRGYSIVSAALFTAFSGIAYYLSDGVTGVIIAEALAAIGTAFFSGALTAWVIDAPDRVISIQRVYANKTILDGIGIAVGTLLGAYIATWSGRAEAFVVFTIFYLLATLFAFVFMRSDGAERGMSEFEALKHAIAHLKNSYSMRWALGVSMATGIYGAYNLYWAPLIITQFSQIELSWIWILLYSTTVVAGVIVRRQSADEIASRNHLAKRTLMALILIAVAMAFVWTTDNGFVWVALIAVHEFGRGLVEPYLNTFVNERIESAYRATYESLQSFLGLFGLLTVQLIITGIFKVLGSDAAFIPWLWLGASLALLAVTGVLWRLRPKL